MSVSKPKYVVVSIDDVPRLQLTTEEGVVDRGVWFNTLFGGRTPTKSLNFAIAWMDPGSAAPMTGFVKHDVEEAEFIISGRGTLEYKDKKYNLKPGVAFYHREGVAHRVTNTGDEPLVLLYVYPSTSIKRIPVERP